jgi:hypothetical protein
MARTDDSCHCRIQFSQEGENPVARCHFGHHSEPVDSPMNCTLSGDPDLGHWFRDLPENPSFALFWGTTQSYTFQNSIFPLLTIFQSDQRNQLIF